MSKLLSILVVISCTPLLLMGCVFSGSTSVSPKQQTALQIELVCLSPIEIQNNSFELTLYGYDNYAADVSATPIVVKSFLAESLPVTLAMEIPENPESLISPKASSIENVKYYLSLIWDNNNNGKQDKGDIVIDFNERFPTIELDSIKKTIVVKER